jgi:hypothetical protein
MILLTTLTETTPWNLLVWNCLASRLVPIMASGDTASVYCGTEVTIIVHVRLYAW